MNGTKIVSGGSAGGALAAAIVYVLSRFGVSLTGEDGALAAVGLIAVSAFVAHNGILGVGRILWRGSQPSARGSGVVYTTSSGDGTFISQPAAVPPPPVVAESDAASPPAS